MSYSDLEFRGRGFSAHDVDLALWMQEVVAAIDRVADPPGWLSDLRDDWQIQGENGFGFGIVADLDRWLADQGRVDALLPCCQAARASLDRHDDPITADELNARRPGGPHSVFAGDLPMRYFRRVGQLAVALLQGEPLADPGREGPPTR